MNPILVTLIVCLILLLVAGLLLGIKGEFRYASDFRDFILLGLYYVGIITLISAEIVLWIDTAHAVTDWIGMPFLVAFVLLGIIPFLELVIATAFILGFFIPAMVSEAS